MDILGVVITDGVGYRNYVMSNFLNEACLKYRKVIVYSGIPVQYYKDLPSNIKVIELPIYIEGRNTWFYRKLKELAHLYLNRKKAFGIRDALEFNYPKTLTPRAMLTRLAYFIIRFFHSDRNIVFFEKLQFSTFKKNPISIQYHKILKQDSPDTLFFTHQRPPFLAPILYNANLLNIKTVSFIFSWDNISSKGRMLGTFDKYLVWSDLMKRELLSFYPSTKDNDVFVVGTPQFEPYVLNAIYPTQKKDFFKKFELDVNKKIICYSCADSSIGKNDALHIQGILSFIKNTNNLQLLVRTSPAEDGKRFEKLKNEFPEIIWNVPKWIQTRVNHVESWSQRLPTFEDVIDLKSILQYVDVNVNMLSTMSLDFMLFDKPVVNTVFGNKENGLYYDQRFLNYCHLEYVIKSDAVSIARNESELHEQLNEALRTPKLRKEYRENLIKLEIGKPLEGTSKRIVKVLKELR